MRFEITPDQHEKIAVWLEGIHKEVIENQRKTMKAEDFKILTDDGKYPYYGAIGGGLTYSFSMTSLGLVSKVKEAITGKELDLTDYDEW